MYGTRARSAALATLVVGIVAIASAYWLGGETSEHDQESAATGANGSASAPTQAAQAKQPRVESSRKSARSQPDATTATASARKRQQGSTAQHRETADRGHDMAGPTSEHIDAALHHARRAAEAKNWELALLYAANALTRDPNHSETYSVIREVAEQSGDSAVVTRCIGLLASAANVAHPDRVRPLLDEIARLQELASSVTQQVDANRFKPEQLVQLLNEIDRGVRSAPQQPERIREWRDQLTELLALAQAAGEVEEEPIERGTKQLEELAVLEGIAAAIQSADMLIRQLKAHVQRGTPERAVVSRYAFLISTQLDTALVSTHLPETWRKAVEQRHKDLNDLLHRAESIWSAQYLQRMREALKPAMEQARQALRAPVVGPVRKRGRLTLALDRLQAETTRVQIAILPHIKDPNASLEATKLMREAAQLARQLELARLDRYVSWACSVLERALTRYAEDRNWTDDDAKQLATHYGLRDINPSYLPPEAARALSWLLDNAIYQELSVADAAKFRMYFASSRPVPLEAF